MNRWTTVLLLLSAIVLIDFYFVLTRKLNLDDIRQKSLTDATIMPKGQPGLSSPYAPPVPSPKSGSKSSGGSGSGSGSERESTTSTANDASSPAKEHKQQQSSQNDQHKVAGLSCAKYGGPADEVAAEMVYWQDIPIDAGYVSPFKHTGPDPKYLTFEPDEGGWNNIRMSMETAVVMAHATGRTLVLPPEQGMYLLHKVSERRIQTSERKRERERKEDRNMRPLCLGLFMLPSRPEEGFEGQSPDTLSSFLLCLVVPILSYRVRRNKRTPFRLQTFSILIRLRQRMQVWKSLRSRRFSRRKSWTDR